MEDRLVGLDSETAFEGVHRLREPVEPLQAPPQPEPGLDPLRIPLNDLGERLERRDPMPQSPQRLATQEGRRRNRTLRFGKLIERVESPPEQTGGRNRNRLVGFDEQFAQFNVPGSMSQDRLLAKP